MRQGQGAVRRLTFSGADENNDENAEPSREDGFDPRDPGFVDVLNIPPQPAYPREQAFFESERARLKTIMHGTVQNVVRLSVHAQYMAPPEQRDTLMFYYYEGPSLDVSQSMPRDQLTFRFLRRDYTGAEKIQSAPIVIEPADKERGYAGVLSTRMSQKDAKTYQKRLLFSVILERGVMGDRWILSSAPNEIDEAAFPKIANSNQRTRSILVTLTQDGETPTMFIPPQYLLVTRQ